MNVLSLSNSPLLFLMLFHFLCNQFVYSQTPASKLLVKDQEIYPIHEYLQWMETDKDLNEKSAYEILKSKKDKLLAPDIAINSGFTNYTYWMLFTVKNVTATKKNLYYQFNNPNINKIDVFIETSGGFNKILSTGAEHPFSSRGYPYHDFVFPIDLESGVEATYLIKAAKKGEIFSTKPELMSSSYFKGKEQKLYLVFGTIMGMMLFNVIINLFLGFSLKENIHFLYVIYVCATLLWFFSSIGIDFQYFFPNHPAWFSISQGITGAITMILMAQLTDVFLRMKETKSYAYFTLNIAKWILIVVLPIKIVVFFHFHDYLFIRKIIMNIYLLAVAGIAIGMIWAAIQRSYQQFKPAWFYLSAMFYLAFSIFKTCYIIIGKGDVSELVSPPTNIQQGLIVETIIIFIGIIYRYNLFKKEKEDLSTSLSIQRLEMANNIVSAQDNERKRLAQDLHDDLGATLSSLLLHISNPIKKYDLKNLEVHNKRSIMITQKALTDLRNISHNLLPKDNSEIHLFQELKNKLDSLNNISNTRFGISVDGDDSKINEVMTVTLFRIATELINNILKHAEATLANIDLTINTNQITMVVEDNGIGFNRDGPVPGIGLKNILSRVSFLDGNINIDTNRFGTSIIIVIPIQNN